ncbi:MAG: magnesium chelatase subunit H [Nodularia sp. (in: Bacteria)]|nr:MAG: magnesium chelatase subunit H [Nodularia sp. (in: cyanobacteria)]
MPSCAIPRLVLISSASPLGDVFLAEQQVQATNGKIFELDILPTHDIQDGTITPAQVLKIMGAAKAVMFDLRGTPDKVLACLQQAFVATQEQDIAFIPVFGGGPSVMALTRMKEFTYTNLPGTDYRRIKQFGDSLTSTPTQMSPQKIYHSQNLAKCVSYWTNAGGENLANLLRFVACEYAGVEVTAKEPIIYPDAGFIDIATGQRYPSYTDYITAHPLNPDLPTVAVLFYGGTSMSANLAGGEEFLTELAKKSNVLPFFADGIKTTEAIAHHFFHDHKPICDAIASLLWFRLDGGPLGGNASKTINLLKQLDVPYHVASTSNNREITAWQNSPQGLPPVETLSTVAFPEMDGAIDPVYLYGLDSENTKIGQTHSPVPGRGTRFANRILHRIALRHKPNSQKRIAIVIFNYPPSEGTLGTASFLDVFASVENILGELANAGYKVTPPDSGTLKDMFLHRGLVHNGEFTGHQLTAQNALRIPLKTYLNWYNKLPENLRNQTEKLFGMPPGDLMVDGEDILIAGIEFGNVVVAVQPSRGVHEDPAKVHHDESLPAHHQYNAFYRWLEEADGWNADAVVHIGTHGTFEFLPAKQVGLSGKCTTDALLGDLPHTYVYHVVNVSEGTMAKRRSYAQLVSYASPTFVPAGLYEHFDQLEDLLDEYEEQQRHSLPRVLSILRQIIAVCEQHDVPLDLADELRSQLQEEVPAEFDLTPYEAALEKLHVDLFELKRVVIPMGLHTFGQKLQSEELVDYLNLIARYDRSETPALPRLLAQKYNLDYDRLLDTADSHWQELSDQSREIIQAMLQGTTTPNEKLTPALTYLQNIANLVSSTDETKGLLHALNGGYIEPACGGDPVRTPTTYPTGRNTFQFDPTKLPTDSAYERGAAIADETIQRYYQQHHAYPDAVGVILWGFETCKTLGETVGQVLRYIGVKVERGQGYFMKPVVIPLSELGRPRVDVTVNICGFFRDLFPNLVNLIDLAFQTVAQLDEPLEMNAVRRHTQALAEKIHDQHLAASRIFGPPPGEYGNRLSTLIETAAWESEADLGDMYIKRTQYVYGNNINGLAAPEIFKAALSHNKFITQVRDSHEFEVTDLDHYYEYFGGMAQATTVVSGHRPDVVIADTTKERIQVKTIAEAVRQGVVSRLLNPKWIDGMLKHDHQGGQAIADRVEYLLGLDATTQSVGTATWSKVAQKFVFNPEMRDRLRANNPYAEAEVIKKLSEANYRGYWQATPEEQAQLKAAYTDIDTWIENHQ